MKKIYLITFLTLLLAKYCYAEGSAPNHLFFEAKQDQLTSKPQCPEGHVMEKDGMLLFGNSEQFYFSPRPPAKEIEEVCTYTTSYSSSTTKMDKSFVLRKKVKRTNCEDKSFNGIVSHSLTRAGNKLIYENKFTDENSKVVSEFTCNYVK
ncbi:hypothetical protein [Bacteriovorax sp. Seq25_V]|uniref:hypothetical protein n=1 Tax=Bacteriovorax sp. Seq25_V TaxID=1201288 RepID=UPI00038A0576|nr:hypothetical protein [Bacteriovorax sp. Seq25_V]EQC44243.1 hypothetical protein M900_A0291 [Bacteriovorax sp. Seq25_V]